MRTEMRSKKSKTIIAAVCLLAVAAIVVTVCRVVVSKRSDSSDMKAIEQAMQVFETGYISTPTGIEATLLTNQNRDDIKGDIVNILYETPEEIRALDIVKRKAFGKDGSNPMPQITEFETYMQTDCKVDDIEWQYDRYIDGDGMTWDKYFWDGTSQWGEDEGSYEYTDNIPYRPQLWLSSMNRIPSSGEDELSCLDYIAEGNSCFLDPIIKMGDDGYMHYDLENHTVLYRHRFVIKYTENGMQKVIMSDWSTPAWLAPEGLAEYSLISTGKPAGLKTTQSE